MSNYGTPAQSRPAASPERRAQLLGYAAGVIGILSFIWGFLDWFSDQDQGVAGYSVAGAGAAATIGLSLTAGLIAAAYAFENRAPAVEPVALAVAALLIVVGILIGKG